MESSDANKYSRGFFKAEIPVWFVLFMIAVLLGIGYLGFIFFRVTTLSYTIKVPSTAVKTSELRYGATPSLANSDYFQKIRNGMIESKASFIEADLSVMKLRVYIDGSIAKEVPIATKGREGSWWETPAGIYKIESKKSNHFSSIGKVYQPWSMVFQGNFFIHGWPYYKDGTPVSSSYSGGCIRLKTEDAKIVYDLAAVGMPVLVYEKDFSKDNFDYKQQGPSLTASQYLMADLKSDYVILGKDISKQAPIASITKLITSLVAAEHINLDKEIIVPARELASTSKPRLKAGQKVTIYNLMFPLLLESSNEAAQVISDQTGMVRFVDLMNQKARALGMTSSVFADPAGSQAGNISTPEDLFALAKYIYNNRSFVWKISSGNVGASAYGETTFKDLKNFNLIPGVYDKFVGGKIGKTTAAGETYMGVFEVSVREEKRPIFVAVLNSSDLYGDIQKIFEYFHSTFQKD